MRLLLSLVFETSGSRSRATNTTSSAAWAYRAIGRAAGPADAARPADGGRAAHQRRALVSLCRHHRSRVFSMNWRRRPTRSGPLVVKLLPRTRHARGPLGASAVRAGRHSAASANAEGSPPGACKRAWMRWRPVAACAPPMQRPVHRAGPAAGSATGRLWERLHLDRLKTNDRATNTTWD